MDNISNPSLQTDLLAEESNVFQYQIASAGQRFLNYLIDNLFMNYGLSYITGSIVGVIIGSLFPDFATRLFYNKDTLDIFLLTYMVGIFNYVIYYTLCEKLFKGYTLGKLITGTRAVKEDGAELSFKDAILRSLSRLVPFEPFSGFGGHPWHDQWTNTMVVKSR